jgi:hypothetical protein
VFPPGVEDRFPDREVLANFSVFNVENYRGLTRRQMEAYGLSEFKSLLQHFCKGEHGDAKLFDIGKGAQQLSILRGAISNSPIGVGWGGVGGINFSQKGSVSHISFPKNYA